MKLAVVLSGGGSKGAFQVGALHQLDLKGVKFDIWVGTSTGSIQAAAGAVGELPELVKYWERIQSERDIFRRRFESVGGWLQMLASGVRGGDMLAGFDALYDTAPLRKSLQKFFAGKQINGKQLKICTASLQSGQAVVMTQDDQPLAYWVYASCAEPVFFQPHVARRDSDFDEQWVDGGVRDITPLGVAFGSGADKVLVIGTNSKNDFASGREPHKHMVAIGLRTVGILLSEILRNDVAQAEDINKLLEARNAMSAGGVSEKMLKPIDDIIRNRKFIPVKMIEPENTISESLKFDPQLIKKGIQAGRDAIDAEWDGPKKLGEFLLG